MCITDSSVFYVFMGKVNKVYLYVAPALWVGQSSPHPSRDLALNGEIILPPFLYRILFMFMLQSVMLIVSLPVLLRSDALLQPIRARAHSEATGNSYCQHETGMKQEKILSLPLS